jgi:hypothetical protein
MYMLLTHTRTVTCYKTSVLSSRRTPHDEQKRNCLDSSQNLVMSPRGAHCQNGRTDWATVSCKVTLTVSEEQRTNLWSDFRKIEAGMGQRWPNSLNDNHDGNFIIYSRFHIWFGCGMIQNTTVKLNRAIRIARMFMDRDFKTLHNSKRK